eukprot:m.214900 g.214900  ORF g.214900 m.214900 type:complete len:215 (+) comp25599_c0_seq1:2484-3128(+)
MERGWLVAATLRPDNAVSRALPRPTPTQDGVDLARLNTAANAHFISDRRAAAIVSGLHAAPATAHNQREHEAATHTPGLSEWEREWSGGPLTRRRTTCSLRSPTCNRRNSRDLVPASVCACAASTPDKNGFFAPFFFATFFLDPFFPDTFFFFGGITPRYHPTPTQPSCPALGCHTLGVSQALVQFSPFDFVRSLSDNKTTANIEEGSTDFATS